MINNYANVLLVALVLYTTYVIKISFGKAKLLSNYLK